MGSVAVIGEPEFVAGYALAGALVLTATGRDEVQAAWDCLAPDIDVVVLTAAAAKLISDRSRSTAVLLTVVMPA